MLNWPMSSPQIMRMLGFLSAACADARMPSRKPGGQSEVLEFHRLWSPGVGGRARRFWACRVLPIFGMDWRLRKLWHQSCSLSAVIQAARLLPCATAPPFLGGDELYAIAARFVGDPAVVERQLHQVDVDRMELVVADNRNQFQDLLAAGLIPGLPPFPSAEDSAPIGVVNNV